LAAKVIWWCGLNRKAAPSRVLHRSPPLRWREEVEVGVVTEAAFCRRGEVADAGSGHVVFVALGNFLEREIYFLRFVGTRLHIPVVVYV
jgi:hypothetical protein